VHIESTALIVKDYDDAIRFFLDLEGNRWDLLGPPRADVETA